MSEEFAFQKILRNGCAVDCDEGLLMPFAVIMDGASDKLLSATALSGDQHGGIAHCDTAHHFKDGLHRLGLADNIVAKLLDG